MRVNAYIDGFNLYYSLKELKNNAFKWLDLRKMCSLFLDKEDILNEVYYFTAYTNFDYAKKARHQIYTKALENSNVRTILGKFKKKYPKCKICGGKYQTYEEKESDVNIAIQLLEDAFLNKIDKAFLITADTDLNSTIVKFRQLFPNKRLILLVPPKRVKQSYDLQKKANAWFEIKARHIRQSLLPNNIKGIVNPFTALLRTSTSKSSAISSK